MSQISSLFVFQSARSRSLLLFLTVVFSGLSVWAVELPVLVDPAATTQGKPVQGPPGVNERMDAITARNKSKEVAAHAKHTYLFRGVPSSHSTGAETNGAAPAGPSGPNIQTLNSNLNFTAATFNDCSGWPPDTMGAIGPTQFITALNGRVRSFNKTNGVADGAIDVDTDAFFQSVMTPPASSNFTTDPRIRYDRLSGRWFIIMIDVPGQQGNLPNRVMIAMSDSGTITSSTVWTFFEFAGDASNFADYPTLGIDANALYIGANIFSTSGSGSFVNTSAFVVRKSSLISGGPIVVTPFTGLVTVGRHSDVGPYTPQGVDNFNAAATEGYFIGVDISSSSTLQLRRVSNPGGTPSLSGNVSISVNSFASPINVTVSGSSGTIDGLDVRLLAAHYRNGALWTSQNVGVNSSGGTTSVDRNGVRWYQITNIQTGQTPSVLQSGTVFQSNSNLSYWMGTVMVSGQGHVAMGCTAAGPTSFLNAAWAGRLAGDAAGTMSTPVLYTASTSAYNPGDSSNPHRWGDFSFTSLDPADDMTMWTIQEWCSFAGNGFAVQAVQILAPLPVTPATCTPSSVAAGSSSVNVVVTGQVNSGSGFFDPGVGFAKHIAATVSSGDVTVNSVTYNNPTNITLNISVSPTATVGTRFITVTNPDGQSVTSGTGILSITGSTPPPPVASFTAGPTIGVVPLTVNFTNTSTGATNYSWSFGDGNVSTSANPINTYTSAGSYTVTLTAIGAGGTNSITNVNYIVVTNPPPPSVSFTGSPTSGLVSLTVNFANATSGATNYSWNFGDGNSSSTVNPAHTYTNAGIYTVTLTAVGAGGTNSLTRANYILVTNPPPPVLSFSGGPTTGLAPLTVNFTNISTGATNYSWDFGDGHSSGTLNPANTYSNAGTYSVTLTGIGAGGTSSLTLSNYIVVTNLPPPTVSFAANLTNGSAPLTVNFTNTSTGATNYSWNFGDGNSSGAADPIDVYTNAGTYSVTLTAVGAGGTNSLTLTNYVVVTNPPPAVAFVASVTNGGAPLTVLFTNLTVGATNYSWDFGDGQTNAAVNPTNVYQSEGSYTVTLTAFGPGGQSELVQSNYIVLSNSLPVLAPIASETVHPGMTVMFTNSATDSDVNQTLIFSLDPGAPASASVDSGSGVFTWTPDGSYVNTTNSITVRVTDDGVPPLSAAQSFNVAVVPLQFQPASLSNGVLTISWGSISGVTYRVQYTTNLAGPNWIDLPPDVTAADVTASTTDVIGTDAQRFYRVVVVP